MSNTKSILIADDDADLANYLALRARGLGVETVVEHDCLSALRTAHEHRPDVACVDVNMPAGNGLGVCEMINDDEQLRHTRLIVLTGDASDATVRRCHSLCAYFVPKCPDVWSRIEPLLMEILELNVEEHEAAGV